ncbi:hypothetical protein DNH61_11585 [Paenibacillus sambharensis]|uniref:Uncharacterized protein n=1 Tax=Paenibacillus sambharensis TaxID=1803190 RepID=A0A2W1LL27_9BACL|nr:hypothetical protein [Paenibacillus sambharensis]PZD95194.1 hypothetical protein DNH61_11585 [Paenibacillus sambharensis]
MDYVIYVLLDCLDTLAVVFLMLAIFQYPIREYLKEITILCLVLGLSSLLNREILGISPVVDLLIHILLLILGLLFLMKVRLYRSVRIVGLGAVGYFAIQTIVVMLSNSLGIVSTELLEISNSWPSRSVQLTSQGVTYLLAYLIVVFDLGRTKYIRPPHDFYMEIGKEARGVFIQSAVTLAILAIGYYIYIEHVEIAAAAAMVNVLFLVIIYLTYRRDKRNELNTPSLRHDFYQDQAGEP